MRNPLLAVLSVLASTLLLLATARSTTESGPPPELVFEGLITPYQTVEVTSAADGLLETVAVDRGDVVSKGDVLATLDSRVQKATLDLAKAKAEAVGEIRTREARLAYATAKLAQDEELFKKGLITELDIETSRTERQVADAALLQAKENQLLAALEEAQARAILDERTVRSPFDGVVVERYLSPGDLLTRQVDTKVLKLAQVSPLKVEVIVRVEYFGQITLGGEAEVRPQPPLDGVYSARVTVVDKVIDAASETFGVRLEIPNEDKRLPAGVKCKVRFLP
jgi:RND family efflux transporter MFP subunit